MPSDMGCRLRLPQRHGNRKLPRKKKAGVALQEMLAAKERAVGTEGDFHAIHPQGTAGATHC